MFVLSSSNKYLLFLITRIFAIRFLCIVPSWITADFSFNDWFLSLLSDFLLFLLLFIFGKADSHSLLK